MSGCNGPEVECAYEVVSEAQEGTEFMFEVPGPARIQVRVLPAPEPPPAEKWPTVVPMVEFCGPEFLHLIIKGLEAWAGNVDKVIVATFPRYVSFYRAMVAAAPNLQIIPGIKTTGTCVPFVDDWQGWREVAGALGYAKRVTGSDELYMGHETAIAKLEEGEEDWDDDLFHEMLETLLVPLNAKWINYPGIWGGGLDENTSIKYPELAGDGMELQARLDVAKVFYHTLDSTIVGQSMAGPSSLTNPVGMNARRRMHRQELMKDAWELLLFYGEVKPPQVQWWHDYQLKEALGHVRDAWGESATAILYSGLKRFETCARALGAQVKALHTRRGTDDASD